MAIVISGFPGIGKSYMYNNMKDLKILDSDSSKFSWVKDEKGENTKERNPDFPNNYIKHIKDNMDSSDIILVSSHKVVRDALKDNGIEYTLVYPAPWLKEQYMKRYINRGSDDSFMKFIDKFWVDFVDEMMNETFANHVMLYTDDTLQSAIEEGRIKIK